MHVSLIGGCHADEPVGPAMLDKLIGYLASLDSKHPHLKTYSWRIVPHANPDGAERNALWADTTVATTNSSGEPDLIYDPALYLRHVVRELPGDDVEFGFPRDPEDSAARPENQAVAAFLSGGSPFDLHGSFHGMGLAPGPWFLIEPSWIDRTVSMREHLRARVRAMGYRLFDVDRQGEKGFHRIDEGFATRPDSGAMIEHFESLGDHEMAARFRPSSMEFVRAVSTDPLTLVSEMPLFLVSEHERSGDAPIFRPGTEGKKRLHDQLLQLAGHEDLETARQMLRQAGVSAMPIRDQMKLQLEFLNQALLALAGRSG